MCWNRKGSQAVDRGRSRDRGRGREKRSEEAKLLNRALIRQKGVVAVGGVIRQSRSRSPFWVDMGWWKVAEILDLAGPLDSLCASHSLGCWVQASRRETATCCFDDRGSRRCRKTTEKGARGGGETEEGVMLDMWEVLLFRIFFFFLSFLLTTYFFP